MNRLENSFRSSELDVEQHSWIQLRKLWYRSTPVYNIASLLTGLSLGLALDAKELALGLTRVFQDTEEIIVHCLLSLTCGCKKKKKTIHTPPSLTIAFIPSAQFSFPMTALFGISSIDLDFSGFQLGRSANRRWSCFSFRCGSGGTKPFSSCWPGFHISAN